MTFSVVIPAYNREKEIAKSIRSVLNQTFPDFEIIVVDDGSTDKTCEVVQSIKDNRIRCIRKENAGASSARNTGIAEAKGLYVSFLDSDDEWLPTMLEKQYEKFSNDDSIGFVYSNIVKKTSDGQLKNFGIVGYNGFIYDRVLKQGFLAPTSVVSGKRELFLKVGGFDILLPASQDDDICFKMTKICKTAYIDEILCYLYLGEENRISLNYKKVGDGWWMLWEKYEDDVIKFCGRKILSLHYVNCARVYAIGNLLEDTNKAISCAKKYNSHLLLISLLLRKIAKTTGNRKGFYQLMFKILLKIEKCFR